MISFGLPLIERQINASFLRQSSSAVVSAKSKQMQITLNT